MKDLLEIKVGYYDHNGIKWYEIPVGVSTKINYLPNSKGDYYWSKIPYSTRNERQGLGWWYIEGNLLEDVIQYSMDLPHGVRVKFLY